jgi:hypothetical protein
VIYLEHKLQRLIELRKLQQNNQTEIDQLVAELSSIIQPKKKRAKKEATLPKPKL